MCFDFLLKSELSQLSQSKNLLMVSGGPDSVFLFHCFRALRKKHKIHFDVVHFNHHLRGKESDQEQKFVEDLCLRFKVGLLVCDLKFNKHSNLQVLARNRRYFEAFKLAKERGYQHLITAHHQDDFLETLIIKAKRGTGIKGLCGIKRIRHIKNPLYPNQKIILFRPLIELSKNKILNYLNKNKIKYCIDSSNLKRDYLRNRVRQDVMENWDSGLSKKHAVKAARGLQLVDKYFDQRLIYLSRHYHHFVPLKVWDQWPEEIQFRFFAKKIKENGFRQQVEKKHFKDQLEKDKIKLDQSLFFKDQSGCYFYSEKDIRLLESYKHTIKGPGAFFLGMFDMVLSLKMTKNEVYELFAAKDNQKLKRLSMNAKKIVFPLHITHANLSERFVPFGKKRKVKLKDFYQSRDLARYQRRFWPVLRDQKREIIAIPGVEIGECLRVVGEYPDTPKPP